jgi:hypothetical protein
MSEMTQDFRRELLVLGIIRYDEHETLWKIAKRCAGQAGVPMGGGLAVAAAGAGAVVIPGVGAIPGYLAGFLAGLAGGSMACTAANLRYRNELRQLLDD